MLTNLQTNAIEQSPSWEANSYSASEISRPYEPQSFIAMLTISRHASLSWTRW